MNITMELWGVTEMKTNLSFPSSNGIVPKRDQFSHTFWVIFRPLDV